MKPNAPHYWTVTLYGVAEPIAPRHSTSAFVGDIDGVLGHADEQESQVDFDVQQFVITRGAKAND